jgi:fumarate reductase subunit C
MREPATSIPSVMPAIGARVSRAAAWRFVLQRLTAVVLAVCVVVHLATIIYAVRHNLTAAAIVARVRGNSAWPAFYALFVVAAAIHAPLGLRVIVDEWLDMRSIAIDTVLVLFGVALLAAGSYAVYALAR